MNEVELQEILEENYRYINSGKILGVNQKCIEEYARKVLALDIDFDILDLEWILDNTIGNFSNNEVFDISLMDVFIDRDTFEDYMVNDFGTFNPVIYELLYQVASQVESKLITYESRRRYYSEQISYFQHKLEDTISDSEKEEALFGVEYYAKLLKKINNKSNFINR